MAPSFFLSLCDLFLVPFLCLVKKPSQVDLDLPVKFLLSRICGEERNGKLIVEQDSSRRCREERGCLGHPLPDRWMWRGGSICWPPRSPDLKHMNLYLWRCAGNQSIVRQVDVAWGFHLLATAFSRLDAHEFISLEVCGKSIHRHTGGCGVGVPFVGHRVLQT